MKLKKNHIKLANNVFLNGCSTADPVGSVQVANQLVMHAFCNLSKTETTQNQFTLCASANLVH
jgi:hypothetical protein